MPRMMRAALLATCAAAVLLWTGAGAQADDEPASMREAWGQVGRGVRNVTRETGHAFRDAARNVNKNTRDQREQVKKESKGVLASLGDALDDLAASIAAWASDD